MEETAYGSILVARCCASWWYFCNRVGCILSGLARTTVKFESILKDVIYTVLVVDYLHPIFIDGDGLYSQKSTNPHRAWIRVPALAGFNLHWVFIGYFAELTQCLSTIHNKYNCVTDSHCSHNHAVTQTTRRFHIRSSKRCLFGRRRSYTSLDGCA